MGRPLEQEKITIWKLRPTQIRGFTMKKIQIIAWTTFLIGIVFKFLHYPGASLLLLLGALLLFIHSIIYLCKNAKTNLPISFLHLSYSILTIYVLFRFQYWPGCSLLFLIGFFVTVFCFFLLFKNKTQFKLPQIFLVVYFVFFFVLSFTHSYKIYYLFNLNTVLNGEARETNYKSWDEYSWFLYIANKQDEVLEANQKAQKVAEEYLKITHNRNAVFDLELIKQHEQQIKDKN